MALCVSLFIFGFLMAFSGIKLCSFLVDAVAEGWLVNLNGEVFVELFENIIFVDCVILN